jgi:AcrR family transcriptional regulator
MARPRSYDEEAVLVAAMHAFRRKGYAAVSIRDLEQATGLKGGSIYNSYGDKAGLFAAAFDHYNQSVLGRRIAEHAAEEAGLDGLRALFLSLLHEPGGGTFGCLITNSAIEFGGGADAPHGVSDGLRTLHGTFLARLRSARASGALRPGVDPAIGATKLLALYQGVLVLVRAGHARKSLKQLIDDEFDSLEAS